MGGQSLSNYLRFLWGDFREFRIQWTWRFWGIKRMKNPALLNLVQDKVFANPNRWPMIGNKEEITYCNLAALDVAHGVGCTDLDSPGKEPLLADQMYDLMKGSDKFLIKPMADCQDLVNAGTLIFAILPGEKLNQGHGHICTLTPGVMAFSGHWDAKAPMCMNLGRQGTCFRQKGVNWAFVPVPEFFAWKESL